MTTPAKVPRPKPARKPAQAPLPITDSRPIADGPTPWIYLPGLPGDTRPRLGRNHVHIPQKYAQWRILAVRAIAEAAPGRFIGPVRAELVIVVGRPLKPTLREGVARTLYVGTPDLDNVEKGAYDALVAAGVLTDDTQIVRSISERVAGRVAPHVRADERTAREPSGCYVRLIPVVEDDAGLAALLP